MSYFGYLLLIETFEYNSYLLLVAWLHLNIPIISLSGCLETPSHNSKSYLFLIFLIISTMVQVQCFIIIFLAKLKSTPFVEKQKRTQVLAKFVNHQFCEYWAKLMQLLIKKLSLWRWSLTHTFTGIISLLQYSRTINTNKLWKYSVKLNFVKLSSFEIKFRQLHTGERINFRLLHLNNRVFHFPNLLERSQKSCTKHENSITSFGELTNVQRRILTN